jgi:hypothetical protein
MGVISFAKVVSNLPNPIVADTVYLVRNGSGFDLYVTDTTGSIAYTTNTVSKAGDTMTGPLVLSDNATTALQAVPKQQLDAAIAGVNIFSINAQTGTTYTLALTDTSKLITLNNASAITVTVPANSSVAFSIGTQINCIQTGAGKVTFSPASGVTINSKAGNKSISAQWVGVSLIKTDTDVWVLLGDLTS